MSVFRTDEKTIRTLLKLFKDQLRADAPRARKFLIMIPIGHFLRFVVIPLLISFIIQSLITKPSDMSTPLYLIVATAVVMLVSTFLNDKGYSALFNHEEEVQTKLLNEGMDHLLHQSYQFFADQKVGTLAGDLMNYSRSYVAIMDNYFLNTNHLVVSFLTSLIVIGFLAPLLLLPTLAIASILILLNIRNVKKRAPYRNERKRLTSLLSGSIADIMGNQLLVRIFASENKEAKQLAADRKLVEDISVEEIKIIEHESLIRQAVLYSFQIIVLALFIWLFSHHMVSVAGLIFTFTYLSRSTDAIFGISTIVRQFEQAFLDAAPMVRILQQPASVSDTPTAKKLVVPHGEISLKDIKFNYHGTNDDAVFEKLSLHIPAGQRVGLAGPSGGGKTTLTKLLLRFMDGQGGSITIDGINIADVTQSSLRESIAYVPQDPFLFHRSLRDNIAYGKSDATDHEITAAAKQAHAMEFIEKLPNGLDTIVGERGVKLSGGQRQRIAIARAILKDAPIIILDEATSALDSESEKYIQQALDELTKNRTSIVIAHRLSTIAKLDRIIVLEDGQIIEDDSHKELLAMKGTYSKLWGHQSGGFLEN